MDNVLILDGEQRASLAAVRSLGQYGLHPFVASHTYKCLASSSRFCSQSFILPDPSIESNEFVNELISLCKAVGMQSIWPMTDVTMALIAKYRGLLQEFILPIPTQQQYEALSNKCSLAALASRLNIPIPKSVVFKNANLQQLHRQSFQFPVVIKPALSRIPHKNGFISTSVTYAVSLADIEQQFQRLPWLKDNPFMIQEKINGDGVGVFILVDDNEPYCYFSHRRIREKPPTGGCSVLSESILLTEQLKNFVISLISEVGWNGAMMAEFKVTTTGVPYLIEVNGRFWGSLQLGISSGVDFPRLLFQRFCEGRNISQAGYDVGVKCRWLLGDLDNLYLVCKNPNYSFGHRLRAIFVFLTTFLMCRRYDVFRISDPKPFLVELRQYFLSILTKRRRHDPGYVEQ